MQSEEGPPALQLLFNAAMIIELHHPRSALRSYRSLRTPDPRNLKMIELRRRERMQIDMFCPLDRSPTRAGLASMTVTRRIATARDMVEGRAATFLLRRKQAFLK